MCALFITATSSPAGQLCCAAIAAIATSARHECSSSPRARLRHLTSGPPAPHAVAVRTYLGCQRIFGMASVPVVFIWKAETLSMYLLSFFTYIFVRPKAAVSTSRRDAGEEGVSKLR